MPRPKMSDDVKEMVVRMPAELHEQVKDRAAQDERTIAQTVRMALKQYLRTEAELAS